MVPPKESIDLECFLVTKHSWKGKYKRILAIGNVGISTYNPDKLDLTNRWSYSDIVSAAPTKTSNVSLPTTQPLTIIKYQSLINTFIICVFSQIPNEFVLTVKRDKKLDSIKLSSEYRNDILTSILKYYKEFADKPKNCQVCICIICMYMYIIIIVYNELFCFYCFTNCIFHLFFFFLVFSYSVSPHINITGLA